MKYHRPLTRRAYAAYVQKVERRYAFSVPWSKIPGKPGHVLRDLKRRMAEQARMNPHKKARSRR